MIKQILRTQSEIDLFLEKLVNSELIAVDKETTFFSKEKFSCQHLNLEWIWLYSWTIWGYIIHSEWLDYWWLDQILHSCKIITHNGLFDIQILLRLGIISELSTLQLEDTKILSFLNNENRQTHGLKYLAENILWKTNVVKLNEVWEKPEQDILEWENKISSYCIDDCINTFELYNYFQNNTDKQILEAYNKIEVPLMKVLIEIANTWISLNINYLKEVWDKVNDKLLELQIEIYRHIWWVIDLSNTTQIRDVLMWEFSKKDISIQKDLKVAQMIDYWLRNDLRIAFLIKEYRKFLKLESTYIDSLISKTIKWKLYPVISQVATVTWRLSCSSPNLLWIPTRDDEYNIRKAFISEKWKSFIIADLNQAELRILTHFSQEPLLIDSLIKWEDIHQITADTLWITRQQAKVVTFWILYWMTEYWLSEKLGIKKEEAKKMIEDYFIKFPKVKELISTLIKLARDRWFIKTISWRRRHFSEESNENQVLNSLIQGSVADLMKIIMIDIQKEINRYWASILLQIHDELIIECPDEKIDEVKGIIDYKIKNSFTFTYVNIENSLKVSKYWIK